MVKNMEKMGISRKLYLSFGSLLVLLLILSLFAFRNTIKSQDIYIEYADQVGSGIHLSDAERGMWELRFGVANFMTADEAAQQKIKADGEKWYRQVEENLKAFASGNRTPEEISTYKALAEAFTNYKPARERWFEIYQSGAKEEAAAFRAQNTNRFGAASVKALSQLVELQKEIGKARETGGLSQSRNTRMIVIWLIGISLTVGVTLSILINRSITQAVSRAGRELDEAANQVAAAAGEVSSSSQTLAEGASQQAAAIEETSASLEEVGAMVKQDADNARQADDLMKKANTVIMSADESMKKLTASMQEISAASAQTQKIVKTIDEIAFQTNLLALNAAVEAARAGAASQQTEALTQVTKAIHEIDAVTQSNAAAAEESASASEELSAQAEMMKGSVGHLLEMTGGVGGQTQARPDTKRLRRPPAPAQASAKKIAAPPKKALPPAATKQISPPAKKAKPKDIIPMDEDFEDF